MPIAVIVQSIVLLVLAVCFVMIRWSMAPFDGRYST